jgi:beta-alanine--pyruvate transaminase
LPEWGAHLADDLERLVTLHDASTIAAVIVEPMAGSAGVILPPKGYLQKLRAICDRHGILLIFDEVITGFGRLGAPFGAHYFDVMPDIITTAKGLTNGCIPMGTVFVRKHIYDAFMKGPEGSIELFHGYTYSAHPVACAAALATQDIYEREGLLTRGKELAKTFEDAVHSLRSLPNVIDIRNLGLVAGVELQPRSGAPGARAYEALVKAFEKGLLIRTTGDTIALSPPLIISAAQIDELVTTLAAVLKSIA